MCWDKREGLLDVLEFRSYCQNFRLAGNPAGMFRVKGDAGEVVPNAQAHTCPCGRCKGQVVAGELLAGQTIPRRFTLHSKLKVEVQWTHTRFALVAQARNIGRNHIFAALIQACPAIRLAHCLKIWFFNSLVGQLRLYFSHWICEGNTKEK
jgi:hypothetical protein